MQAKRILVVDDSSVYRRMLTDIINKHPQLEVVGVAVDGREALEQMHTLRPDVVTLDILMPKMDGIQTLMELRRLWPRVRIVMVSSLTSEGSDAALDALTLGAHDYVIKPFSVGENRSIRDVLRQDLLPRIEALCALETAATDAETSSTPDPVAHVPRFEPVAAGRGESAIRDLPELVLIGVSTGGPDALTRVMQSLPGDLEAPICIVQHMPPEFTGKLAARLDATAALSVREACSGDRLQAGNVYIAPGDFHMILQRCGAEDTIRLNRNPPENSCRPSVDPLFRSAAAIHGSRCLGVVMTGMGQDGLKGSEVLVAAGAAVLVQDEASSVVWGMPRLVAQAGLAEEQVPLTRMAEAIVDRVRGSVGSRPGRVVDFDQCAANDPADDGSWSGRHGL